MADQLLTAAMEDCMISASDSLANAVQAHLDALSLVDAARQDGVNVHGAISNLIGADEMLRHALNEYQRTA
ncbi:hypothetical protein [Stenotrophomonas indicatrix]|uniref:hypothetical protein n=1 Tax=Stenotrophomonas indicatrix TaxID=2045451 RepID=UPI0008CD75EB|nr:hypothetical protein [Stenotrophomonas indicatrix]SEU13041.1 hypothetical protein SAMN05720615_11854 [Stenotrophomonas indicatrix]